MPGAPTVAIVTRAIYVAPDGNRKANGLTPATAVTPQKADELAKPGDVVLFAAGEYTSKDDETLLTIRHSGESGKPITYAPAPGAKVVLRNKGGWNAIKLEGVQHIIIQGFRVIGNAPDITKEEAMREMSNMSNRRTCGNGIGVDMSPGNKVPSAHVTVRYCDVSDCPGGGILASHVDYLTFEHNVVYRCAFWSPYGNSGISVYQPTAIDDSTDYKIFIRDNVCFGIYQNIPFYFSNKADPSKRKVTDGNGIIIDDYLNTQSWGGGSGKPYTGRTLVTNNVMFANGGSGIHSFKSCNVDIIHNYAVDNNRHPELKDGQIFANTSKNMRIFNNIIVAPPGKPATSMFKNEALYQDYNLYANLDGSPPMFDGEKAHNLVAAPGLVLTGWDQGKRTFNASPDSALRQAGMALTEDLPDYFGKPRNKAKPDIGPFVLDKP